MRTGYRGVSLQKELVDEVERLIEIVPGYPTKTSFVAEAVRLRLQELKSQYQSEPVPVQEVTA